MPSNDSSAPWKLYAPAPDRHTPVRPKRPYWIIEVEQSSDQEGDEEEEYVEIPGLGMADYRCLLLRGYLTSRLVVARFENISTGAYVETFLDVAGKEARVQDWQPQENLAFAVALPLAKAPSSKLELLQIVREAFQVVHRMAQEQGKSF